MQRSHVSYVSYVSSHNIQLHLLLHAPGNEFYLWYSRHSPSVNLYSLISLTKVYSREDFTRISAVCWTCVKFLVFEVGSFPKWPVKNQACTTIHNWLVAFANVPDTELGQWPIYPARSRVMRVKTFYIISLKMAPSHCCTHSSLVHVQGLQGQVWQ